MLFCVALAMGLRPNRSLLNHNFEGYRLNCKETSSITQCTPSQPPLCSQLTESYYSFQLLRAFSSFNHLVYSSESGKDCCYFIDKEYHVVRCEVVRKFAMTFCTSRSLSGFPFLFSVCLETTLIFPSYC